VTSLSTKRIQERTIVGISTFRKLTCNPTSPIADASLIKQKLPDAFDNKSEPSPVVCVKSIIELDHFRILIYRTNHV
jgi:hypothetical protein